MLDAATRLNQVRRLKEILVLYATGDRSVDGDEYKRVRGQVLQDAYLKPLIPWFIQDCVDLGEFWGFIKPKFSTYRERREFLRSEFLPVIRQLEASAASPTDQIITDTLATVDWVHVQEAWRKALGKRPVVAVLNRERLC